MAVGPVRGRSHLFPTRGRGFLRCAWLLSPLSPWWLRQGRRPIVLWGWRVPCAGLCLLLPSFGRAEVKVVLCCLGPLQLSSVCGGAVLLVLLCRYPMAFDAGGVRVFLPCLVIAPYPLAAGKGRCPLSRRSWGRWFAWLGPSRPWRGGGSGYCLVPHAAPLSRPPLRRWNLACVRWGCPRRLAFLLRGLLWESDAFPQLAS